MGSQKVNEIYITVVICTRNRVENLTSVLDSLTKLVLVPHLVWELIVVDNGSTDGTADLVAKYINRLPIRCVRENRPGLSNARNRGLAEAEGKYICWTDDDVIIDSYWLSAYAKAFKQHPEASVFGGKIIPFLQGPTPEWFEKAKTDWPLTSLLAQRDLGDEVLALSFNEGNVPWGANFAVRSLEQKRHRYNPELGVSPVQKRIGEETDVIYRIFKAGGYGWWVPDSKVTHIIPPYRQTLKYLYEYSYLGGETFAYLRDKYPNDNHLLALSSSPPDYYISKLHMYCRAGSKAIKYLLATLFKSESRLTMLRDVGFYLGAASYRAIK